MKIIQHIPNLMFHKKNNTFIFACFFVFSFFFTFYIFGSENFSLNKLIFTNNYDLLSDQLALKFFLNDSWHFPFGKNPNYGPADGSSIVFVGGAPILAFISKIFKFILPNNFNLTLIWYLICFFLQSLFGYLIIFKFTKNSLFSFVASFLFIFCPIFLDRIPSHLTLSGQWIILLCFYFEFQNLSNKRIIFYSIIYSLCSLIHFYFIPIIFIIQISYLIKRYLNNKNIKTSLQELIIPIIILLIISYLFGYFQISMFDAMGYGYGYYKFNLLGFFDPQYSIRDLNWSIFLNDIKNLPGEKEGFSYLGLGGIFLLFIFIFIFIKERNFKIKDNINFYIIIFISIILSASNNINVGGYQIFSFELPKVLYGLLSIVRASGRFIWLINYLIIIFGIVVIYKFFKNTRYATLAISFILIFQILDISPALKKYYNSQAFNQYKFEKNNENFWKTISNDFDKIKSTKFNNTSNIFLSVGNQILKYDFKSTDISRSGRYSRKKITEYRSKANKIFSQKKFEKNTIYVAENLNHLKYFKHIHKDTGVGFFFIRDNWFIVPGHGHLMKDKDFQNLDKISLFNVVENKKYYFQINKNNALGIGWTHNLNKQGVWSEGNICNLLFNFVPKKENNYKLILNINSIMTKKDQELHGTIKLNDKKLKEFVLSEKKLKNNFNLEFSLPFQYLNKSDQKIDIVIENPISPLDLLRSPDSRKLGVLLKAFEISSIN